MGSMVSASIFIKETIMSKILIFELFIFCVLSQSCADQPQPPTLSDAIRLNQIGFYPDAPKVAIIAAETEGEFYLSPVGSEEQVFTGKLTGPQTSTLSGKKTMVADFSEFQKTGNYILTVPGIGHSYPFEIKTKVHEGVATAALKSFYFQRMSTDLPEKYAGKWHRSLSHPDDKVMIHASAATKERPEGTIISSPSGWYDAGDYNKYIVNSAISVGTMLSLYEDFPDYFQKLETNIPESGNGVPDLLDETLYNLKWMLTMQDPNDGGVYHKCTTAKFEGMVKPEDATNQRYVVQKSTAAALGFAASMAQSARVFSNFETEFPGFAGNCLAAAKAAWQWAEANPNIIYDQNMLNKKYDPDIVTGAYDGSDLGSEKIRAAAELYTTTSDNKYLQAIELSPAENFTIQNWRDVRTMGYFTLLRHLDKLPPAAQGVLADLKTKYLDFADSLIKKTAQQAYLAPMENDVKNYVWGSTAVCANQGVALIYAYRLTGDEKYLNYALADLDYLLGRNATGYSFVTGYGSKTPMHIHHRPSESDGIDDPVPGLIAGGPNPRQQDKCSNYPNNLPDESYTDEMCSYASNEIAINWNAPLVYLAFAVDILKSKPPLKG